MKVRPALLTMSVCVALLAGCGTNAALDVDTGATAPNMSGAAGADAGANPATSTTPSRRALSVAVGLRYACAVLEDHTVKCWGANTASPFGSHQVLAMSADQDAATCAIVEDGSVTCWNGVAFGPTLPASQRAVSLAMGQSGGCANLDASTPVCWSDPAPGVELMQSMLVPPIGTSRIRQICDGCAGLLYEDGTVSFGSEAPHLLNGHAATSLAGDHGGTGNWCATLAYGGTFCNGILPPSSSAVITALSIDEYGGQDILCALDPNGKVSCRGITAGCNDSNPSQSYWCVSPRNSDGSHDVALGQPALAIVTGSSPFPVSCALLADGSIKCWGGPDINSAYGTDPILGASVPIIDTPSGPAYGPWRAIDLDSLP
jgi:hypothetical protein